MKSSSAVSAYATVVCISATTSSATTRNVDFFTSVSNHFGTVAPDGTEVFKHRGRLSAWR